MFPKSLKFFRKNLLTIILTIVPPLAMWYFLQRESPDLSITVISKTPVVSLADDFSDGIEIFHNKKSIDSLYVTDIIIKNEGNKPIERSDFDEPLTFSLNGTVISSEVIDVSPKGLHVKVKNNEGLVEVEKLLLNPTDEFKLRLKIINPSNNNLLIEPNSRIKAIKEVSFYPYKEKESKRNKLIAIIATIASFVSVISLIKLLERFKTLRISLSGLNLEYVKELEKDASIKSRVEKLAEQLTITGHDIKSNILLLRLKIENQLRELAKKNGLHVRNNGSVNSLSDALYKNGLLEKRVVSLIRDISPAMNRELHESETYLDSKEFEILQHSALSIIAVLEDSLNSKSDIAVKL